MGVSITCAAVFIIAWPASAYDSLRFGSIEQLRTPTDARERMTHFEISEGRAIFSLRETPTGSLEPKVRTVNFRRETKLLTGEAARLIQRVTASGLLDLPESAEHRGNDSIWTIFGTMKGRPVELSWRRPPRSGLRKRVDEAAQRIIHELGFAELRGPANAQVNRSKHVAFQITPLEPENPSYPISVAESEGDLIPARNVTMRDLIRHSSKFDGKRVSVIGFYHGEFEGSELRARERSTPPENVWCDQVSAFAAPGVDFEQDRWARVEGTFFRGPAGHFGLWPGEIVRVTRFDIQLPSVPVAALPGRKNTRGRPVAGGEF